MDDVDLTGKATQEKACFERAIATNHNPRIANKESVTDAQ